jgi:hypothetical protein
MRLAWVTVIHLDLLSAGQTDRFFAEIAETGADGVVVGGCGHTHSGGECHPLPNLRVLTGAAEYSHPGIQQPLLEV